MQCSWIIKDLYGKWSVFFFFYYHYRHCSATNHSFLSESFWDVLTRSGINLDFLKLNKSFYKQIFTLHKWRTIKPFHFIIAQLQVNFIVYWILTVMLAMNFFAFKTMKTVMYICCRRYEEQMITVTKLQSALQQIDDFLNDQND